MLFLFLLKARHPGQHEEAFAKGCLRIYNLCQPAGEDEERAYNVWITEEMGADDVLKKVLCVIDNIKS